MPSPRLRRTCLHRIRVYGGRVCAESTSTEGSPTPSPHLRRTCLRRVRVYDGRVCAESASAVAESTPRLRASEGKQDGRGPWHIPRISSREKTVAPPEDTVYSVEMA